MRNVDLDSWTDFPAAIAEIRGEFGTRTVDGLDGGPNTLDNRILFRGQADSQWRLETTLERATTSEYTVERYLQRADSCVNEIESVTGRKWNLQTH